MVRLVAAVLVACALCGCAQPTTMPAPALYAEYLQAPCEPSAYVRPPDELERPATADAQPAPAHDHGMGGHAKHAHGGAP